MSDPSLEIPTSMQPTVDVRQLAAEANYAYWLRTITLGRVSEAEEAEYVRPKAQDFAVDRATKLMTGVYQWLFDKPEAGLLKRANYDSTKQLLGRAATVTSSLVGLDIATVQELCIALQQHSSECHQAYLDSTSRFADTGDMTFSTDEEVTRYGRRILGDLVEPNTEELKETLLSGFVDMSWADLAVWDQ